MHRVLKGAKVPQTVENLQAIMEGDAVYMQKQGLTIGLQRGEINNLTAQLEAAKRKLESAQDDVWMLDCLHAAGVDSWEGVDEALEIYNGK